MTDQPDELLTELRALPPRDLEARTGERLGREAARAFTETAGERTARTGAGLAARSVGSLALAATVVVYLSWAVNAASALLR